MPDLPESLLVHPLRHRLLLEYSGEADCPARVARRLRAPLNLVAYHTRVLQRHGLVALERTERHHGALSHFYRATIAPVIDDEAWATLPQSLRRALAHGTVSQALGDARQAARAGGFDPAPAHLTRSRLQLDREGRAAVSTCLAETVGTIAAIAARSRARGGPSLAYETVLLAFEDRTDGEAGTSAAD